jgi:hypothetical protein
MILNGTSIFNMEKLILKFKDPAPETTKIAAHQLRHPGTVRQVHETHCLLVFQI